MNEFKLKKGSDFIDLMQLLKVEGIAQTGGHAKLIVEEGDVFVNDEQEFRKRRKLRIGDVIVVGGEIEIKIV